MGSAYDAATIDIQKPTVKKVKGCTRMGAAVFKDHPFIVITLNKQPDHPTLFIEVKRNVIAAMVWDFVKTGEKRTGFWTIWQILQRQGRGRVRSENHISPKLVLRPGARDGLERLNGNGSKQAPRLVRIILGKESDSAF